MPGVSPFRGLVYSLQQYGGSSIPERVRLVDDPMEHPGELADISDLVCPPYDVIEDEQRRELLSRHPRNAVRLEASAERDPYGAAARALADWRADGSLTAADPSVYYYAHARSDRPDGLAVHGVVVRVLLEPWGSRVRPHERTLPGPKADRLALLRATRTQLSPILAIYFDRSERYRHVMSRGWSAEWRARDGDGLLHQLGRIEPDERLINYLARQQFFVADGHHRYETALAYQHEIRASPGRRHAPPGSLAADWIMAVLVNAEFEELEIRATHRLLRGVDPAALAALASDPGPLWDAHPVAPAELPSRLDAHRAADAPVFGVVLRDGGYLLTGRPEPIEHRMRRERMSSAARRLDLAILHAAIFSDRLGIDAETAAAAGSILYTKDAEDGIARVSRGEVQAAFLVRPTRIDQLAAVARAGDVMPQKSTYFYPKLLTGMVFNPLED